MVVTHLDSCYASITLKAKLSFHHIFTSIIMNYIYEMMTLNVFCDLLTLNF